ncbi:MAG: S-methyl-5-thioribose-1-phosphate isomerase [Sphingomonadales bacterium]
MRVNGRPFRTIWPTGDRAVEIIDQTRLPHEFKTARLETVDDAAHAIKAMLVRGAPLIGATAAYGICLAVRRDASNQAIAAAADKLLATRPTAVNLRWAVGTMQNRLGDLAPDERLAAAYSFAGEICDRDVEISQAIGRAGLGLIREIAAAKADGAPVNILTHCNAGWLATVDWGTATAPIYKAHRDGIDVHIWVDETRPRNQGAALTAFELGHEGVAHTVIADNAGGHLMQHDQVDLCIVGTDRTTAAGDVANKIGTYLKALAAKDNGVPFYVALPSTTIDWTIEDGVSDIPIEQRGGNEVSWISGRTAAGQVETVRLTPEGARAANYAFDVTPAKLITGLITERGVLPATVQGLAAAFPEHAGDARG